MRAKSRVLPTPEFIGNCDLALIVGSGLAYNTSLGYGLKLPQNLIHIMLDGQFIDKNYPATVGIVGDSKAVLNQMLAIIGDRDVYKGDAFAKEVEEVWVLPAQGPQEQPHRLTEQAQPGECSDVAHDVGGVQPLLSGAYASAWMIRSVVSRTGQIRL